ncbi:MAG: S8 family serine peptidase, partial [Pseudomonadota bacterium]
MKKNHRTGAAPAIKNAQPFLSRLAVVALGAFFSPNVAYSAQQDTPNEVRWAAGRLLMEPRAGLSDMELGKFLNPHGGRSIGRISGTNVHVIQLPSHVSEKAVAALLARNEHLKFVELDVQLKPGLGVDDPYFGSAWHLPHILAPAAWDTSTGRNITIAILDSGVDAGHPEFAGKLVPGWNFFDNNSDTSDVYGHGTIVAGAAAAASNNALGVASVAGEARIMPIRVTDTAGSGYLSQMAQGITWAADRGARVANLSFAGAGGYATVQSAAQYMKNKGGLVITAAGNYGREETFAANSSTMTVSATDGGDAKASWSSYGNFVDIAAPGVSIWTTTRGGGYGAYSGTSLASPVMAGVAALVMSANPALKAVDAENILFSTAVDLGSAGFDIYYGYGRVNAAAAVLGAVAAAPRDTTAPSVAITSPGAGDPVKGLVAVNVNATDNVGISRVDLLINGVAFASDTTAPYGFSWDTTSMPDGNATLTAYAYDAAGNLASSA